MAPHRLVDVLLRAGSGRRVFANGVMARIAQRSANPEGARYPLLGSFARLYKRAEPRRKQAYIAVSVAGVLLAGMLTVLYPEAEPQAEVTAAYLKWTGEVKLRDVRGYLRELRPGPVDLAPGTQIDVGSDGEVNLRWEDATGPTVITVQRDSVVEIAQREPAKHFRLKVGTLSAKVSPQAYPLEVHSAYGNATVVGTTFRLSLEDQRMQLQVTEGRVRLESVDGESLLVTSGQTAITGHNVRDPSIALFADEARPVPELVSARLLESREGGDAKLLVDGGSYRAPDSSLPLQLELALRHQTALQTTLALRTPTGHQLFQADVELEEPLPNQVEPTLVCLPILPPGDLPEGFVTLSLDFRVADSGDASPWRPLGRRLTFRVTHRQTDDP